MNEIKNETEDEDLNGWLGNFMLFSGIAISVFIYFKFFFLIV